MLYSYMNQRGELVELSFPMGQAPDETQVDGVVYRRDRVADFGSQQFSLKGSGWPSQDARRKEQMTRNNNAAGQRTRDRHGAPKSVVPNYKGQVTETWDEAGELRKKDKVS